MANAAGTTPPDVDRQSSEDGSCRRGRQRWLVRRHFRGQVDPREEAELRAHLPGCASCREHYDRHLLYAELVHGGRSPADRIGIGLGLRTARPLGPRALLAPGPLAAVAVAAALLLVVGRGTLSPPDEFGARGTAAASRSTLEIYRVPRNEKPAPAGARIAADDELAFAYRNPMKYKHLLVFGVDEAQNVYWFHPAWNGKQDPPVAIPIAPGVGPHELGEAVRHELRGRALRVVGLFTNRPISVAEVEQNVRRGNLDLPNAERSETVLQVERLER